MMVANVSETEAADIMMQANWNWNALVGEWEEPEAQHVYEGMKKAGLQAHIIAAEEGPGDASSFGRGD